MDPQGVSFAAAPARFEEVFGTRLQARQSHFECTGPIEIPRELAEVAEAVVLARPPQLFP